MTIDERLQNITQQLELLTGMQKDSMARADRLDRRERQSRQAIAAAVLAYFNVLNSHGDEQKHEQTAPPSAGGSGGDQVVQEAKGALPVGGGGGETGESRLRSEVGQVVAVGAGLGVRHRLAAFPVNSLVARLSAGQRVVRLVHRVDVLPAAEFAICMPDSVADIVGAVVGGA